ncbi:hypothetical protein D3C84_751300 [compost metagenome]
MDDLSRFFGADLLEEELVSEPLPASQIARVATARAEAGELTFEDDHAGALPGQLQGCAKPGQPSANDHHIRGDVALEIRLQVPRLLFPSAEGSILVIESGHHSASFECISVYALPGHTAQATVTLASAASGSAATYRSVMKVSLLRQAGGGPVFCLLQSPAANR